MRLGRTRLLIGLSMTFDPTGIIQQFFGNTSAFQVVMWAVVIIVILSFLRKAWPTMRNFVRTIDALADLPEALTRVNAIEGKLDILDELRPNHGGSIRDHVTKTSKQVEAVESKLNEHIDLCKLVETQTGSASRIERLVDES